MTSVAETRAAFGARRVRPALALRLRRRALPWLLMAPSLALLAAFTYLPIGENGGALAGVTFAVGPNGRAQLVEIENFKKGGVPALPRVD